MATHFSTLHFYTFYTDASGLGLILQLVTACQNRTFGSWTSALVRLPQPRHSPSKTRPHGARMTCLTHESSTFLCCGLISLRTRVVSRVYGPEYVAGVDLFVSLDVPAQSHLFFRPDPSSSSTLCGTPLGRRYCSCGSRGCSTSSSSRHDRRREGRTNVLCDDGRCRWGWWSSRATGGPWWDACAWRELEPRRRL